MSEELDWSKAEEYLKSAEEYLKSAEEYLKSAEEAYTEIGSSGRFAMQFVINPARDRFNQGERTKELYDEIFEIAL